MNVVFDMAVELEMRTAKTVIMDVLAMKKSWAENGRLKEQLPTETETETLRAEIKAANPNAVIVGQSEAVKNLFHQIGQVALTDSTV